MNRTWTNEQFKALKEEYPTTDTRILAKRLGKTERAIKSKARVLGVKKSRYNNWTPDQDKQLTELYANTLTDDIAIIMGLSIYQVRNRAYFLGLKKSKEWVVETARKNSMKPDHGGRKFRFKKGLTPQNKGKKQAEFMSPEMIERSAKTRFRKGHTPANYKPIGTRRLVEGGYLEEKIAEPDKWELAHRLVWEQANGKIPKGFNVQFKDGDRLNIGIDNLYLIQRSEQILSNSGSINLTDGMVACYIAGGRYKNKPLLEIKRQQLLLNREIKARQNEDN